jgi:hypothetical protein
MKKLLAGCLVTALCLGAGANATIAQSGAKDEAKKAGEATKDAGKATGDAAKHAGKATAKGAKTGAKRVKAAVTGDVTVICNDGKKHSGKTNEAACAEHGGIRK